MSNTYTQLYIQYVFSVKGRQTFIKESFRDEKEKLCAELSAIINVNLLLFIVILTYPYICRNASDNFPILLNGACQIRFIKMVEWQKYLPGKFSWHDDFGLFTYSKSQMDKVAKYGLN